MLVGRRACHVFFQLLTILHIYCEVVGAAGATDAGTDLIINDWYAMVHCLCVRLRWRAGVTLTQNSHSMMPHNFLILNSFIAALPMMTDLSFSITRTTLSAPKIMRMFVLGRPERRR